jgi:hypothetical protein
MKMQMAMGPEHWLHHGYVPTYADGQVNRCPSCLRSQWYIGRSTAECAFCGTALPLESTGWEGNSLGTTYWDRDVIEQRWHSGDDHDRAKRRREAVWEFEL